MNLGKDVKNILIQAPLASGGSDPTSTIVDMQNFEGCMFTGIVGTAGSTDVTTLAISESSSSSGSWNALSGITASTSAGESDVMLILDVYKPLDRFLRATLTRSDAVEYGGTLAQQYMPFKRPTTHDSSTLGATLVLGVSPTT
jgi:hypothetical protein